jgi:hypothetical protein
VNAGNGETRETVRGCNDEEIGINVYYKSAPTVAADRQD